MVSLYQFCTNGVIVQNHLSKIIFQSASKLNTPCSRNGRSNISSWSRSYQDGHSSLCQWMWTVRSILGSPRPGRHCQSEQLARLHTLNQQDIISCLPTHACTYVVSHQPLFSASLLLLSAPVCLVHEINLHDVSVHKNGLLHISNRDVEPDWIRPLLWSRLVL